MPRKKVEKPSKEVVGQELLSLDAAAEALQVSRSTLTRWLSEGRVKGFKVGRQWRFRRTDLDKFSQMAHPSAAAVSLSDVEKAMPELAISGEGQLEFLDPVLTSYPSTEEEKAIDRLFGVLALKAFEAQASDIHLDAERDASTVRFRIDGVLQEVARFPLPVHRALVACIKLHAGLAADQTAINQDGRLRVRVKETELDLRVATLPSISGETVVIRLLAQSHELPSFERMGMSAEDQARYLRGLRAPTGLLIVSGPTGSGKTTVLYSGLQQILSPRIKAYSIEDPVELRLRGLTQVPVVRRTGMTFEHILRSLMRADPDVITVGQINSQEVGEGCLQAAITGHLVLSTLHAQTAASAITRMLDMGLEPFLLAESLVAVVAVRLARRLCPHCAQPDEPELSMFASFAERARAGGYALPDRPKFMRKVGCEECNGWGYRGRIGLFEVMEMDQELARLVLERASAKVIQEAAVKKGMTTLAADGMRKAAEGITSVVEAMRVTQGTDA